MFETTRERLARSQHPHGIILQRGNHFEEKTKRIECGIDLTFMRILFVLSLFFLFFFFTNRTLTQRSTGEMKLHDAVWMKNIV